MKYKLTKNTKKYFGRTLYQIEATKDFGNVEKGDLGGYIEKEDNLSQEGNCWVYGNARVSGNAEVSGNARVSGNAWVSGNARVYKQKLIGGYFYHTKLKSEKIESVETCGYGYETLACNPKLEEDGVGKKVRIKLAEGQIVEGEIIE
jgi:hypothetical protein